MNFWNQPLFSQNLAMWQRRSLVSGRIQRCCFSNRQRAAATWDRTRV